MQNIDLYRYIVFLFKSMIEFQSRPWHKELCRLKTQDSRLKRHWTISLVTATCSY